MLKSIVYFIFQQSHRLNRGGASSGDVRSSAQFYDTLAASGRRLSSTHALINDNLKSVWPRHILLFQRIHLYACQSLNGLQLQNLKRRRSNNHNSNSFFNCNSFRTHQVGTPTFSLPNLVGHLFSFFSHNLRFQTKINEKCLPMSDFSTKKGPTFTFLYQECMTE